MFNVILLTSINVRTQLVQFGVIQDCAYNFVDRNGWPVSREQENDLYVIDVLHDMCVTIAWPSDTRSERSPDVIQKTSVTTLKLKRSFSVEPYSVKRPRSMYFVQNFKPFLSGFYFVV